ncbi:MAG TPA: hypothetical protein VGP93_02895, partial [Polyangiaceae bacterium]|nr:hypothetical protein [Polyangiaceae bacterium]
MLVPALIAVAAVGLGLALGLVPSGAGRVVGPLRTFALTAALAVAATHLLPEAFATLGGVGLVVFACGLSLPAALRLLRDTAGPRASQHHDEALEFGYAGLLVHHVADGLGLGAYGGGERPLQLDVLLALAVHTVPLVAVLSLAYSRAAGVRVAVLRSAGLALASVLGVLVSALVTAAQAERFEAWVAAGVAGLLVHVVTHDLERDLPDSTGWRLLDLAAALAGIGVSLAAAAKTAPETLLSG